MSLKDLFGKNKKTRKDLTGRSVEDFTKSSFGDAGEVESVDYYRLKVKSDKRFFPNVDFPSPRNLQDMVWQKFIMKIQ